MNGESSHMVDRAEVDCQNWCIGAGVGSQGEGGIVVADWCLEAVFAWWRARGGRMVPLGSCRGRI